MRIKDKSQGKRKLTGQSIREYNLPKDKKLHEPRCPKKGDDKK
jgi:hypothetical protein